MKKDDRVANWWCKILNREGYMIGFYLDIVDINSKRLETLPYVLMKEDE